MTPLILAKAGEWHVRFTIDSDLVWAAPSTQLVQTKETLHSEELKITVISPNEEMEEFTKSVAAIIRQGNVIKPKDRERLTSWLRHDLPRTRDLASWLNLRSYLADGEWWDDLERNDDAAITTLQELVSLSLDERVSKEYRGTPVAWDATLCLTVSELIKKRIGDAKAMLKEVPPMYKARWNDRVRDWAGVDASW